MGTDATNITDEQLLQLGRSARKATAPSREDWMARSLVPVALGLTNDDRADVKYAREWCANEWNRRFDDD